MWNIPNSLSKTFVSCGYMHTKFRWFSTFSDISVNYCVLTYWSEKTLRHIFFLQNFLKFQIKLKYHHFELETNDNFSSTKYSMIKLQKVRYLQPNPRRICFIYFVYIMKSCYFFLICNKCEYRKRNAAITINSYLCGYKYEKVVHQINWSSHKTSLYLCFHRNNVHVYFNNFVEVKNLSWSLKFVNSPMLTPNRIH